MISRRSIFGVLAGLPFVGRAFAASDRSRVGCFVPERYKRYRWHVIKSHYCPETFEVAEWVTDPRNGPREGGHWVRWGYCGDFPSLCQAEYIGPVDVILQRSIDITDRRLK